MRRPWGSFFWQLERKRKYYMSFQTRATSTVATAVTFSFCLLFFCNSWYVNLWSGAATDMPKNMSPSNSHQQQHRNHLPSPPPHSPTPPPHHQQQQKDQENAPRPKTRQQIRLDHVVHTVFDHAKGHGEFSGTAQLVKPAQRLKEFKSKESSRQSGAVYVPHTKEEDAVARLQRIFKKVDVNKDGSLTAIELSDWINERIRAHFSTALRDNIDSFFGIDRNPRNGRVEWSEYLDFHLTKKMGYQGPKITPESVRKRTEDYKKLSKEIKVEIAALEAQFSENANNDPDYLTVDEFLSFTHPEASPTKLLAAVQDTFSTFDLDGDGIITKTEFDETYQNAEGVDSVYKEDLHLIDIDKNTQISRVELMRYMDPKNTIHADKDANSLIKQVDDNKDGRLALDELKKHLKFVLNSKLYDAAKNLHRSYQLHS